MRCVVGVSPAAQSACQQKTRRDRSITASPQELKVLRGTKRVCQACATPYYDLARSPIVCPSCGAHHVPAAPAPAATVKRADRTSWRDRRYQRPAPEAQADSDPQAEPDDAADAASTEGEDAPAPNDDVVLDEETDEPDN